MTTGRSARGSVPRRGGSGSGRTYSVTPGGRIVFQVPGGHIDRRRHVVQETHVVLAAGIDGTVQHRHLRQGRRADAQFFCHGVPQRFFCFQGYFYIVDAQKGFLHELAVLLLRFRPVRGRGFARFRGSVPASVPPFPAGQFVSDVMVYSTVTVRLSARTDSGRDTLTRTERSLPWAARSIGSVFTSVMALTMEGGPDTVIL